MFFTTLKTKKAKIQSPAGFEFWLFNFDLKT